MHVLWALVCFVLCCAVQKAALGFPPELGFTGVLFRSLGGCVPLNPKPNLFLICFWLPPGRRSPVGGQSSGAGAGPMAEGRKRRQMEGWKDGTTKVGLKTLAKA